MMRISCLWDLSFSTSSCLGIQYVTYTSTMYTTNSNNAAHPAADLWWHMQLLRFHPSGVDSVLDEILPGECKEWPSVKKTWSSFEWPVEMYIMDVNIDVSWYMHICMQFNSSAYYGIRYNEIQPLNLNATCNTPNLKAVFIIAESGWPGARGCGSRSRY